MVLSPNMAWAAARRRVRPQRVSTRSGREIVDSSERVPSAGAAAASSPADVDQVRRAQSGDRQAFAQLYERYFATVHGVVLAHAPARELPDLVQEVFLTALRQLASLDDPARFGSWLAVIARHLAQDAWRRARNRVDDTQVSAAGESEGLIEHIADKALDSSEDRELAERALAALGRLPAAYRETLVLRLVEGLSGPQIAERTGMTAGSVRVNLCRGMKLLREQLEPGARES